MPGLSAWHFCLCGALSSVGAALPAIRAPRFVRSTALSFFAGKHRSHRSYSNPLERGLPANLAPRAVRPTALSFFAGKHQSHRSYSSPLERGLPAIRAPRALRSIALSFFAGKHPQKLFEPVGARLAREPGATGCQVHRVIVLRGQAPLPQKLFEPVGARLARDKGASVCQVHRVIVLRGQALLLTEVLRTRWSEACPR